MTGSSIGVGLIGAGRIGRVHAANLVQRVPRARLLAVADVNAAAAEHVASQWGGVASDDPRRLLDDPKIDAVLICSTICAGAWFLD